MTTKSVRGKKILLRVEGLVLLLVAENILWMQTLKLKILSEKYTFPVGIEPTSH